MPTRLLLAISSLVIALGVPTVPIAVAAQSGCSATTCHTINDCSIQCSRCKASKCDSAAP